MKDIALKAIDKMKAAGFNDAEARVSSSRLTEMQIDAGEVSLMRTTQNTALSLRGIMSGRYASVRVNQLSDAGVDEAVRQVKESASVAPVDSARHLVDGGGSRKFNHGPTEPDRETMFKCIETFGEAVRKSLPEVVLEQSGLSHTLGTQWAVNSKGLDIEETHGSYNFGAMFSAKRGDKVSSFNYYGAQNLDLKHNLLEWGMGRELMESSVREIDHQPFQGKFTGPLLLSPMAFHGFINGVLEHTSDGRLISKTSVLQEKMNQKICAPLLTVKMSPRDNELASREFTTGDGYLSEPSTVIENGVLKTWMLSDYGSRKTGLPRAVNNGSNMVVTAGTQSRADLARGLERGIYLGRFSGGHPAANGDFSGIAKNSYLIEGGKITKPIAEVMISGNLFEMLNQLRGISQERLNDGSSMIPWAVVDGVTVSGV